MKPIIADEALTVTIVSEPLISQQDETQYKHSTQGYIWRAELCQHRSLVGFLDALETILIGCAHIWTHSHLYIHSFNNDTCI